MNKYISIGLVVLVLSIGLVTAERVELFPVKVVPSGKEITIPAQVIDATQSPENRLIVPTTSELDKLDLQLKGCQILHELSDATAISCPPGISIKNARADRIFTIHDWEADVQINADDVWALGYTGSGVKVAILDTGVDTTHIELTDSIIATKNFVRGSGDDLNGHGTHVSGIITANGVYEIDGNNATGVAPGTSILVGKVCGTNGCYESDIIAGIEWAVVQGADVLSMSLGGGNYGSHCDGDPLAAKVNWAVEQGLVVTVSAGNEGRGVSSPACASGAIAVGAVDKSDIRASWSNYGNALDLVAPGVDILSTYSCKAARDCTSYWYAWMSGTSMSAPHVAGVAALILDRNPSYTVDQVKAALYNTAVDLEATGWDQYNGWGRVDALGAVMYGSEPGCNDADGDGYTTCEGDCNDNDVTIHPVASETVCNGIDNDCDLSIDEEYVPFICGTGACARFSVCESGSADCTPGDPTNEVCGDLIDNDCDGTVDEVCPPTAVCGDRICSGSLYGEDCRTCPADCRCVGKNCISACCGDGICKGEKVKTCPVDCQ